MLFDLLSVWSYQCSINNQVSCAHICTALDCPSRTRTPASIPSRYSWCSCGSVSHHLFPLFFCFIIIFFKEYWFFSEQQFKVSFDGLQVSGWASRSDTNSFCGEKTLEHYWWITNTRLHCQTGTACDTCSLIFWTKNCILFDGFLPSTSFFSACRLLRIRE